MSSIDETINKRKGEHGPYIDHAVISQELKLAMQKNKEAWLDLDPDMRESLEMIQHKVARIINGDKNHIDSWHDIQGYARLVEARLEDTSKTKQITVCFKDYRIYIPSGMKPLQLLDALNNMVLPGKAFWRSTGEGVIFDSGWRAIYV